MRPVAKVQAECLVKQSGLNIPYFLFFEVTYPSYQQLTKEDENPCLLTTSVILSITLSFFFDGRFKMKDAR